MGTYLLLLLLLSFVSHTRSFSPTNGPRLRDDIRLRSVVDDDVDVRFLGRGPRAVVRPGCVLLAPREEFHHFLRRAAVFVYAVGEVEDDGITVVRGVVLDHPTPFEMGEMISGGGKGHPIYENLLFRGGELGNDSAFLFHSDERVAKLAGLEQIGTSGIYQGGMDSVLSLDPSEVDPDRYKFFFNYMEFTEQELENMLEDPQDDGDAWASVEVPPEIIVNSDYDRGEAWAKLRNAVRLS